MKVWDCFLFNGEYDLLKIRCEELFGLDVSHVLIEATMTFTGKYKPLHYLLKRHQYTDYNIKHFITDTLKTNVNAWQNETNQRNYILTALEISGAKDEDVIIVSDGDEIVRKSAVEKYNPDMGLTALQMDIYWYKLNLLAEKGTWVVPRILTYKELKQTTPDEIRRSGYPSIIHDAGWHMSYIGNEDFIVNKLQSFSHQEYNTPEFTNKELIKFKIEKGQSLWGESNFKKVTIDDTFPTYLYNNQSEFKHLIA